MPEQPGRRPWHLVIAWVVPLALLAVAGTVGFPPIRRVLTAARLMPVSESYTAMFFTDPNALPSAVRPGDPIRFRFTVNNMSAHRSAYRWEALVNTDCGQHDLHDGSVMLAAHASVTVPTAFTLLKGTWCPVLVAVRLLDQGQRIEFHVQPLTPPAPAPTPARSATKVVRAARGRTR